MPNIPPLFAIILPLIAAILGIISRNHGTSKVPILDLFSPYTSNCLNQSISPHYSSWNTWFNPSRYLLEKGEGGDRKRDWNILYHLGGNGPWIEKVDGNDSDGIKPPDGCAVEQVHLMSRHAERYPTHSAGNRHLALLNRIKETNLVLNGSLAFLNNWTYFTSDPSKDFEQLTTTGPYAGTLEAFTTGVRFRTRYEHLLPKDSKSRFWASDSERVIQTAQYFASGLFGQSWEKDSIAELQIIPETADRRADTLTPGDTCLKYIDDLVDGHDKGIKMLSRFHEAYIPAIAERLRSKDQNPNIKFSNVEIFGMQEMCGFETLVRGSSPWCDVFSEDDWDAFEYARDLIHYYRAGPGTPYSGAMGWLWLNATPDLLQKGPEAGTMFFSFVHDGDIAPFLTALEIFKDEKYDPALPTTHVAEDRVWRTSSVMPMGGRVTLERLTCSSPSSDSANGNGPFIRININDGIIPLPYCQSGPGKSCPLSQFVEFVQRRRTEVGEFGDICGLEDDVGRISFLHQD